jgi:hypothetical protein
VTLGRAAVLGPWGPSGARLGGFRRTPKAALRTIAGGGARRRFGRRQAPRTTVMRWAMVAVKTVATSMSSGLNRIGRAIIELDVR